MDKQKRPLPYMDKQQQERAIIYPISHYKEASSTTIPPIKQEEHTGKQIQTLNKPSKSLRLL